MKQLDKIAFVENFTFFLSSSCVHLKFPEFESIGEYQKKNNLKILLFRFSLASKQNFLNTKIVDN